MDSAMDLSFGASAPFAPLAGMAPELLSKVLAGQPASQPARCTPQQLKEAITWWCKLLGADHVHCDTAILDRYAQCTLPTSTRPCVILEPANTREVSELVKIAAHYQLPLHPISRGKNWGYGDACAPGPEWVIVDLGRMNGILEVNEQLAYAVVEPGVTQGDLHEFLCQRHPSLMLDVTGAGPDASIVGNTLQRGFGHTPYGNHFLHASGLEVVLADGRIIHTGFGAHDRESRARYVFPWGQGPYLDGLFTQSRLGIVTRMGIWLMPKPETIEAFAFSVPDDDDLAKVVEQLRWLKLHDVVRGTVHIANDLRVISAHQDYPHELSDGKATLPLEVRRQLRREYGIGAWNVMGGLYGAKEMVAAAKRIVRRKFGSLAKVQFFNRRKLQVGARLLRLGSAVGIGQHLARKIASASSVYDLICGIPTRDHLRGALWRSKATGASPDPGQSGLIWVSPVIEAAGEAAAEVSALIANSLERHGFDPLLTLSTVTDRSLVVVASIHFDKQNENERGAAAACAAELKKELGQRHYYAYRTGVFG